MQHSFAFLRPCTGLCGILLASLLGIPAKADDNATTPLTAASETNATIDRTATETPPEIIEVNATSRFDDLRIRITHDPEHEDKFTLDLILVPKKDSEEETLDKRIDKFFKPLADMVESIVFWAPDAPKLELILKKGAKLVISGKADENETALESHAGLTVTNLKDRLNSDSILEVKGEVPEARPLENRSGSKNNPRSPSNDKFSIPTAVTFPFVLLWLVVGAIVFTLYFRFVNVRCFRLAIDIVRDKYSKPSEKGEVSHFQALSAALSGTVGLGNIAGVAVAISLGGPGATFWMIVAGFLGMSSKFVECTLGVKYRQFGKDGRTYGGPMHYLRDGLANKGWSSMGKVFAVFFAIMCVGGALGGGNMFQVNQAFAQFEKVTGGEHSWIYGNGWLFGVVIAILVALVIIGGIRSIARVTARIVPFMCGIYVAAAIVVLVYHYADLPTAINQIISGAFDPHAVTGGFVGVLIQGFKRAAFSNEAGIGSASIA
ncbi:MAG: alanine:cation symporter family protein, partial [Opitutales bacterium]